MQAPDQDTLIEMRQFAIGLAKNQPVAKLMDRWVEFSPQYQIRVWVDNPHLAPHMQDLKSAAYPVKDGVVDKTNNYELFQHE